jgi:hypothetical protein
MERKPLPLLEQFLDQSLPFPALHWEAVPGGVNPLEVREAYDDTIALLHLFCECMDLIEKV